MSLRERGGDFTKHFEANCLPKRVALCPQKHFTQSRKAAVDFYLGRRVSLNSRLVAEQISKQKFGLVEGNQKSERKNYRQKFICFHA